MHHVVVDMSEEGARRTCSWSPTRRSSEGRSSTGSAAAPSRVPRASCSSRPRATSRSSSRRRLSAGSGARLSELRAAGIEAHGQVAHPDPYTATVHAVRDERVDEIIISTFPGERSGWLRRDLVGRVRRETGLPVEHVVTEPEAVGASPTAA